MDKNSAVFADLGNSLIIGRLSRLCLSFGLGFGDAGQRKVFQHRIKALFADDLAGCNEILWQ